MSWVTSLARCIVNITIVTTACVDAMGYTLHVQVAAYEFTTLTCIPGVVHYRGAKIQMLDLPGIIEGAKDGKGRGRQVWTLLPLLTYSNSW